MKFLEYQVKERFRAAGVPVPDGRLAHTPDEAALAAGALGAIAVKAQVPVGGRGKAGGIKLAQTAADAKRVAGEILGMTIKGYVVKEVLCETAQEITRELYLGLTLDRDARSRRWRKRIRRRSPSSIPTRGADPCPSRCAISSSERGSVRCRRS